MYRWENIKFLQDIWHITEHFLTILETEQPTSETEEFPGIKEIKQIPRNKINSLVVRGIMWTVFWLLNYLVFINDLIFTWLQVHALQLIFSNYFLHHYPFCFPILSFKLLKLVWIILPLVVFLLFGDFSNNFMSISYLNLPKDWSCFWIFDPIVL